MLNDTTAASEAANLTNDEKMSSAAHSPSRESPFVDDKSPPPPPLMDDAFATPKLGIIASPPAIKHAHAMGNLQFDYESPLKAGSLAEKLDELLAHTPISDNVYRDHSLSPAAEMSDNDDSDTANMEAAMALLDDDSYIAGSEAIRKEPFDDRTCASSHETIDQELLVNKSGYSRSASIGEARFDDTKRSSFLGDVVVDAGRLMD